METEKHTNFGSFFESLRQRKGLTLREFCKKGGADPANISRMERGVIPPPQRREILERYAVALGIESGSDDWYQFFDLAAAGQGRVPEDLMTDSDLVKALPAFFRTLRGQKPTPEEMKRIAETIKRGGR